MIRTESRMGHALQHIPLDYDGIIYWLNEPGRPDQGHMEPCDAVEWKLELEETWPNANLIGPNNIVESLPWVEEYYACHFEMVGEYPDASEVAIHWYAWAEDYTRDEERFEALVAFYQSHNNGQPPDVHLTEYGITYWVPEHYRTIVARQFREQIRDDDRIVRAFAFTRNPSSSWRFLSVFDEDGHISDYGCGMLLTNVTHPDCP